MRSFFITASALIIFDHHDEMIKNNYQIIYMITLFCLRKFVQTVAHEKFYK